MSLVRRLAERALRNVKFIRRLGSDFGAAPIVISPGAGLRFALKPMSSADPQLLRFASEFVGRGAVVWDVGANLGLFTTAAAARSGSSGSVVSFEPDIWLAQMLRRTAQLQSSTSAPIEIVPMGIGKEIALRKFVIANRSRATNHFEEYGTTQTGGVRETQTVPCTSLDWIAEHRPLPNVLKIDVEGAEIEVFEGARNLFERAKPVVHCEVGRDATAFVSDFLSSRGYLLYDAEAPAAERRPLPKAPWNLLAIHGSTHDRASKLR
jgi:FkbM family methyltransferase